MNISKDSGPVRSIVRVLKSGAEPRHFRHRALVALTVGLVLAGGSLRAQVVWSSTPGNITAGVGDNSHRGGGGLPSFRPGIAFGVYSKLTRKIPPPLFFGNKNFNCPRRPDYTFFGP